MPTAHPNADQPIREFSHTYPWRGEEIGTIAFLALVPAGIVTALRGWDSVGSYVAVGLCAALAVYLYHLHTSRVKRSTLRAEMQGTLLRVTGNGHNSSGNLADMAVVRVTSTHKIDPVLNFETRPNGYGTTFSVRVPMRLARLMAADLAPHLKRCNQTKEAAPYCQEIADLAARQGPDHVPGETVTPTQVSA